MRRFSSEKASRKVLPAGGQATVGERGHWIVLYLAAPGLRWLVVGSARACLRTVVDDDRPAVSPKSLHRAARVVGSWA
ncbi:MAG: hypothetical protein GY711_19755 [bacterium]|nr:hypothetical protein [bacterium]